jgi:hypothetical protein
MLDYTQIIPIEGRVSETHASYTPRNFPNNSQLSFNFKEKLKNGNGFKDPAFADNKTQPLHRWVPWIAGFSAQFVQDCFETLKIEGKNRSPASWIPLRE